MSDLKWVGWIDLDGSHLSTWVGKTRYVAVVPVPTGWHPSSGVPDPARVYELPQDWTRAREAEMMWIDGGVIVIVFDSQPKSELVWPP